jgi:hypothetical protein
LPPCRSPIQAESRGVAMLDVLDKELEKRDLHFVRYADDVISI